MDFSVMQTRQRRNLLGRYGSLLCSSTHRRLAEAARKKVAQQFPIKSYAGVSMLTLFERRTHLVTAVAIGRLMLVSK